MARVPVALYGAGHFGRQVHHHLLAWYAERCEVLGFIDDTQPPGVEVIGGRCTLGALNDVRADPRFAPGAAQLVFAVGYASMTARRAALARVLDAGYELFGVIHPRASIEPGAEPGAGSVVLACAVLDQQVRLGPACFVDIGVRLGAGTVAGANNWFSSGTSTGSRVRIGEDCFFGMDCTLTTDITVGSNLFVNAKTLLPRDVGSNLKLVELHQSRELPQPR